MVTLSDVAARAGVSVSAVSRVLRNAPSTRVSAETRQRIEDAARELGYRPNFAARALKSSRTNVIGLVVPVVTNAIFADILRGAEEEAQRHGYLVFVARTEGMIDGEETIPRLIGEGRVDGVLLQVGDAMRPEDLHIFLDGALPLVVINSVHHGHAGSVTLDDARGIRMATEHLIGLGHTRIGFLGGLPRSDSGRRREQGFREAMADAGLAIPDGFVTQLGYEPRQGARRSRVSRHGGAAHRDRRRERERGPRGATGGATARYRRAARALDRRDARHLDGRERLAAADHRAHAARRVRQAGGAGSARADRDGRARRPCGERPGSRARRARVDGPSWPIDLIFSGCFRVILPICGT
ncbi:hypothetical protein GCM10025869_20690 [Homoserinibacter gongjuensis]|uniref:HTH lacI-type domain-containing protein n=1 Tax=Homoserinibacter gongjuensis TaxID=1162968 RepID=A0ABQ6JXN8_9MICO|nr:LacI family DNA-binding transcriptional regulator [Homoserinibacter gongjuensis]GMA91540.1 hypothetical protein GCM10025869_20690 [Homoserinibacter gongjuensis]